MSDHLPECQRFFTDMPEPDDCPACGMFRLCEQRVLAEREADGPWFRSIVHQCCEDKQTAYTAGLDAAREAVDGLDKYHHGQISAADAIAAIDALREKL
jgi:hypothetical protein